MSGLVDSIRDLASRPVYLEIDKRQVGKAVYQTVGEYQAFNKARPRSFGKEV
jgi:hypothetical protein